MNCPLCNQLLTEEPSGNDGGFLHVAESFDADDSTEIYDDSIRLYSCPDHHMIYIHTVEDETV